MLIIIGIGFLLVGIGIIINQPVRKEPKATILRKLNPSYSYCGKCKVPWKYVRSHDIRNSNQTGGVFYMCEECWNESTIDERLLISYEGYLEFHQDMIEMSWKYISEEIKKGK